MATLLRNVYGLLSADEETHKGPSRCSTAIRKARDNLSSLNESPRDLWVAFLLKFCDSYGYFSVSQVLVLYLHQEFGISDLEAGAAYGAWGVAITGWGLLMSVLNDYMGVRNALLVGFATSSLSYILLANARSKSFVFFCLFCILPLGNSLGIPMISIGIKRFTTPTNRGFAFGIFYSFMNLAAFISGPIIDAITRSVGFDPSLDSVSLFGVGRYSANRCVILTAAFSSFCSFFVTLLLLRDVKVDASGREQTRAQIEEEQQQRAAETCDERWAKLVQLLRSATFWRFSLFTLLLINLNAVFRHLDATFPTYLVRTYGSLGENNKGLLYSINPLLIILLVPLVAAATTSYAHFDMIKWGGYVTALAPFSLALASSIPACVGMVVLLSLGEAIWSPRTYDYTYSIAPNGQEASFAALAAAPLFAAKIPVGLLSGYLLNTYCPEGGPNRGQVMWLIIGLVTLTSPILVTLLEKVIREPMIPPSQAPPSLTRPEDEEGEDEEGHKSVEVVTFSPLALNDQGSERGGGGSPGLDSRSTHSLLAP
jgi:MFS family permease